ncbi:MAG: EAL domain-containing protein, partial [Kangiella sp.]|nr:EAL domain-containing protein [Kangiella sp.]
IDKIETESNSQIIVKSIVDLANNFGISSVAEGVENENQLNFLKSCDCKEAQGYYFAKPMKIDELKMYMSEKYSLSNDAAHN